MSTISVYYTDEGEGTAESGPWDTYDEARSEAFAHAGRVIEYEYEFSDSRLLDDFTADHVEDVATELTLHWNVEREEALAAVRSFTDAGGDGSGMAFADHAFASTSTTASRSASRPTTR